VLDEPANGLDPAGIRWLREFLRGFARSGGAVSVSSHLLGEIAQLADEVVVIQRGRLVAHTTVGALTTGSAATVRVRTPQADRLTGCWWRPVPRSKPVNRRPSECSAWAGAGRALAADARVVLHELVGETHSLEDVFLELTGEEAQDARVG